MTKIIEKDFQLEIDVKVEKIVVRGFNLTFLVRNFLRLRMLINLERLITTSSRLFY